MSKESDRLDDVGKALKWMDRRQWYGIGAVLLGYVAWFVTAGRLEHLVESAGNLPENVRELLSTAVFFALVTALATQFFVANYITIMSRRLLQAIHVASSAAPANEDKE